MPKIDFVAWVIGMSSAPEDQISTFAVPRHGTPGSDDRIRDSVSAVGPVRERRPDVLEMIDIELYPLIFRHSSQDLPEVQVVQRRNDLNGYRGRAREGLVGDRVSEAVIAGKSARWCVGDRAIGILCYRAVGGLCHANQRQG